MTKACFKCGLQKPLSDFYKHPAMADGLLGKCKECTKADAKATRKRSLEYYRQYDRDRNQTPNRIEQQRTAHRLHAERYPQKTIARHAVTNAVRDGRMVRRPCERCGDPKTEAHHSDYDRPLDVIWLCMKCHRLEHGVYLGD